MNNYSAGFAVVDAYLTGRLPKELGNLSNLGESHKTPVAGALHQIVHLLTSPLPEFLQVSGCSMTGTLPSEILLLSKLGKAVMHLLALKFNHAKLTSSTCRLHLSDKDILNLQDNGLTGALPIGPQGLSICEWQSLVVCCLFPCI